jgi:hypothetical protein
MEAVLCIAVEVTWEEVKVIVVEQVLQVVQDELLAVVVEEQEEHLSSIQTSWCSQYVEDLYR